MHISNLDDAFCGCVICQLQNRTFCPGWYIFIPLLALDVHILFSVKIVCCKLVYVKLGWGCFCTRSLTTTLSVNVYRQGHSSYLDVFTHLVKQGVEHDNYHNIIVKFTRCLSLHVALMLNKLNAIAKSAKYSWQSDPVF